MLIHENDEDIWARSAVATCLLRTGETGRAKEQLEATLSRATHEDAKRILLIWSGAALAQRNYAEAKSGYRRVLQIDPDDRDALHHYALILAAAPDQSMRDAAESIECARRLCEQECWAEWRSLSVLAAAEAEAGNITESLRFARLAFERAPVGERAARRKRIEQYERGEPYRLG